MSLRFILPSVFLLVAVVTGCAPKSLTPTLAQGEAALKSDVQKDSHGKIAVVAFAKTEGQAGEIYGVSVYRLNYTATLRTTETATIGRSIQSPYSSSAISGDFEVPAGQEYEIKGKIEFEKKESGWVATEISSYRLPNQALEALIPKPRSW